MSNRFDLLRSILVENFTRLFLNRKWISFVWKRKVWSVSLKYQCWKLEKIAFDALKEKNNDDDDKEFVELNFTDLIFL